MDECAVPKLHAAPNEAYIFPNPSLLPPSPLHLFPSLSLFVYLSVSLSPFLPKEGLIRSTLINPGRTGSRFREQALHPSEAGAPRALTTSLQLLPDLHSRVPFHHQSVTHTKSVNHFSCQNFQLGLPCPPRL